MNVLMFTAGGFLLFIAFSLLLARAYFRGVRKGTELFVETLEECGGKALKKENWEPINELLEEFNKADDETVECFSYEDKEIWILGKNPINQHVMIKKAMQLSREAGKIGYVETDEGKFHIIYEEDTEKLHAKSAFKKVH